MALVGFAGVGLGSLAIVKDRIRVVVQEDDVGERPDPLALVRDELKLLHTDLEALSKALGQNLETVGRYLERIGAGQERDARRMAEFSDRLQADLRKQDATSSGLGNELVALRRDLARIERRLGDRVRTPVETNAVPVSELAEEKSAPDASASGAAASPPVASRAEVAKPPVAEMPSPVAVEPSAQPKRGIGFLSFSLPSNKFAFDEPQHYRVLPSLSRVGFDAKSTLHDFSGVTSKLRGDVWANLASASYSWHGQVSCDATTLKTGVEGRDENMREKLLVKQHPRIRLEIRRFEASAGALDPKGRRNGGIIHGRMTIAGKARDLQMPVKISVDRSMRVVVEGQQKLKLSDFGIEAPSKMGLISMQDEVVVWISLRARSVGAAGEAEEARHED